MDINLALMAGIDIPIPECHLIVHQPTIKEIAYIGEEDYFMGVQCLCVNKNTMLIEDNNVLANTSNFQIFMTIMSEKETADKKASVLQVLTLLFPKAKVLFTPRSIVFSSAKEDNIMIDETNFDILQNVLRQIFCISQNQSQDSFNPEGEKAKEIAKKLMRGRQRVAAQNQDNRGSMFARYVSIITTGFNSISLKDSLDLTPYQLYDLMERYSLYMNWDLDIRSRLAGGNPDSKPDNWMKNIH